MSYSSVCQGLPVPFPLDDYSMTTRVPDRAQIRTTLTDYAGGGREIHAYYGQQKG